MARTEGPLTYATYLSLPELLATQQRRTDAHDELQFIVVHQVFELWFKLMIFELEGVRAAMEHDNFAWATHLMRRTQEILKNLLAAFPVIETMRPYDFMAFRSELKPASGFQSLQFREIEFLSGPRDDRYLRIFSADPQSRRQLERRMSEPTLWDAFMGVLARRGMPVGGDEQIIRTLILIHSDPALTDLDTLVEALLEYDLLFALWRSRHVLMVERMIGGRTGTGESDVAHVIGGYRMMGAGGVDYLKGTLGRKFFPLIWEARTFVER